MKKKVLISLIFSSVLFMTACNSQTAATESSSSAKTEQSSEKKAASGHFDYQDQGEWEQVSGKMQSPIDIPTSDAEKMNDEGDLTINYNAAITKVENNGHSIQVTDSGESVINGRTFELTQFHFHAESEHTIDGKHYPIEAHFVNQAQDGRLAVIGVFFKEGAENKGFQEVLDNVANDETKEITDIQAMLPSNLSYYHYLGSLTTPPLTENVEWYVLKEPVEVSKAQIEAFQKLYDHNNREVQPLNDRVILEHSN